MNKRWIRITPHNNLKYKQIYDMVNGKDIELRSLGEALGKKLNINPKHYVNEYTLECLDSLVNKAKYFGVNVSISKNENSNYSKYSDFLFCEDKNGRIIEEEIIKLSIPAPKEDNGMSLKYSPYYSKTSGLWVQALTKGLYMNKKGVWYKHYFK